MRGTRPLIAIGLTVALFAVAGCGGSDEASSDTDTTATETTATETTGEETTGQTEELYATVGPGFTISLTTEDGTAITTLPAGSYKVEVDDKSDAHNFHLTGPGAVDVSTEVADVTEVDWTVDLEAGTYKYQCDPHASTMNGSFEVTG